MGGAPVPGVWTDFMCKLWSWNNLKKIKTYYLSSVKNEEHYFKTVWVVIIYMVWCVVSMKRSRHGTAWTCQKTFGGGCSNSVFWAQYLWPKKQVHHTLSKHQEPYRKETYLCVYIHLCNTWLEKLSFFYSTKNKINQSCSLKKTCSAKLLNLIF